MNFEVPGTSFFLALSRISLTTDDDDLAVPHPTGTSTHTRRKDRISYTHEEFAIDLTQVSTSNSPSQSTLSHELEIEISRPEYLVDAAYARDGSGSEEGAAYDELIRAFVNNARIMVRNADGGEGAWG